MGGFLTRAWFSIPASPEAVSVNRFHSAAQLRRVAHGMWVILATAFHLQRLRSSEAYLTAFITEVLYSFPSIREVKSSKRSSLSPTSGCGAAPSGLLSGTAGNTALLHLPASWQSSTSHMLQEGSLLFLQSLGESSRTAGEAEQRLQTVSHSLLAF